MSRARLVVRFDALAELVLTTARDDGVNQPLAELPVALIFGSYT